jgi:hypothetical protein
VPAAVSVTTTFAVSVSDFLASQADTRVSKAAAARPRFGEVHAASIGSSGGVSIVDDDVHRWWGVPLKTYAGAVGWFQRR